MGELSMNMQRSPNLGLTKPELRSVRAGGDFGLDPEIAKFDMHTSQNSSARSVSFIVNQTSESHVIYRSSQNTLACV